MSLLRDKESLTNGLEDVLTELKQLLNLLSLIWRLTHVGKLLAKDRLELLIHRCQALVVLEVKLNVLSRLC